MKRLLAFLSALLVLALAVPHDTARACMSGVQHPTQDAFLFFHDGVEVLVWRATVTAPGDSLGGAPRQLPRQMAWVLAVPQAPLAYAIVDPAQFDSALDWAGSLVRYETRNRGESGGGPQGHDGFGGLDIGATEHVGEYEVTPIETTGARAGADLRRWLRRNGFTPPNRAGTQYYIDKGWTFLAVKARLPRATAAELHPLSFAFRTHDIVLPVHLVGGETPFAMRVNVFSSQELTMPASLPHGFTVQQVGRPGYANRQESLPSVVLPHVNIAAAARHMIRPMIERIPELARLDRGSLSFARIEASPVSVTMAEDDLHIALGTALPDPGPAPR